MVLLFYSSVTSVVNICHNQGLHTMWQAVHQGPCPFNSDAFPQIVQIPDESVTEDVLLPVCSLIHSTYALLGSYLDCTMTIETG